MKGGTEEMKEEKTKFDRAAQEFGLEDLKDPLDRKVLEQVYLSTIGNTLSAMGRALSGSNEKALLKEQLSYQRALMEQFMVAIRQLNRIEKKLGGIETAAMLREFREMLDDDLISREDYDRKRRQLLGE